MTLSIYSPHNMSNSQSIILYVYLCDYEINLLDRTIRYYKIKTGIC